MVGISGQTKPATSFKHLAVHLMVLLLPNSYMKPLLMLPEGECYTYIYGGLLLMWK